MDGNTFNLVGTTKMHSEIKNLFLIMETIQSFTVSGLPDHIIDVKIGCPLILIRNLDVHDGLCNGTKMQLLEVHKNVLKVKLLDGKNTEKFIHKCWCSDMETYGFTLQRFQFTVFFLKRLEGIIGRCGCY